jgi:hypothetical protein
MPYQNLFYSSCGWYSSSEIHRSLGHGVQPRSLPFSFGNFGGLAKQARLVDASKPAKIRRRRLQRGRQWTNTVVLD